MFLYLFNPETNEYIGKKEAILDRFTTECKGSESYWLEPNSTFIEPELKKGYICVWNGSEWEYKEPPTAEEVQLKMTQFVQNFMDVKVQERGYDSILSACSYVNTGIERFDREGEICRVWRSAVWNKCYEILADVQSGKIGIPTEEDLIEMLPKLEW